MQVAQPNRTSVSDIKAGLTLAHIHPGPPRSATLPPLRPPPPLPKRPSRSAGPTPSSAPPPQAPPQLPPRQAPLPPAKGPALPPRPTRSATVIPVRPSPSVKSGLGQRPLPPLDAVPPPIIKQTPKPKPAISRPPTYRPSPPSLPSRRSTPNLGPGQLNPNPVQSETNHNSRPELLKPQLRSSVTTPSLPVRRDPRFGGFGGERGKLPSPPRTPEPAPPVIPERPPPIPSSTKPKTGPRPSNLTPRPSATRQPSGVCLKCRDFSHVDAHAAKFPRHAYNDVQRLALDLTTPFQSATDKARVIFTWLHHNVVYDVDGFFSGKIKPSTPADTLSTGLAVCEGFAGLFAALAVYAGLEAVVVGGHGKGFGYTETEGNFVPPFEGNHAWNACRIDDGEWHLIDPCWGAGHLDSHKHVYKQEFAPEHFTQTNEQFGKRHFPQNSELQFSDRPLTWEQYITLGKEGPLVFSHMTQPEFNFGTDTVEPRQNILSPYKRHSFRIAGVCEHTPATKSWVLVVNNGQNEECMQPDGNGGLVANIAAGASGTKIQIRAIHQFRGRSAEGLTLEQWNGRHGTSWSCSTVSICEWTVR